MRYHNEYKQHLTLDNSTVSEPMCAVMLNRMCRSTIQVAERLAGTDVQDTGKSQSECFHNRDH